MGMGEDRADHISCAVYGEFIACVYMAAWPGRDVGAE
jgi:hypothetical protein